MDERWCTTLARLQALSARKHGRHPYRPRRAPPRRVVVEQLDLWDAPERLVESEGVPGWLRTLLEWL